MADATATFAIQLDTTGVVRPGDDAAQALERLRGKIQADTQQLAGLQAAMRNLKGGSSMNIDAFRKLKDGIAAHKAAIGAASGDYVNLGGSLTDLVKKASSGTEAVGALGNATALAGGPLGGAISKVTGLASSVGKAGLVGALVGAAAAMVALTAAVAAGTIALISYGVAQANARRSELLHLQGLTTIRNWYGIAAGKAGDLQHAIDKVSGSSALGRDKVAGYAEQLYKAGLRGKNLEDALDATAIKASVQGDAWASLFVSMAAGANMSGQSVAKLSDQVRTRLGGIAKAQALDFGVQMGKLHESITELFGGVKVEGFLSALHEVTNLFSQNSITGQQLKRLITGLFAPLDAAAAKSGPELKRFFQGGIIMALRFTLVLLKTANWLKATFGEKGPLRGAIQPFRDLVTSAEDAFKAIQGGDWTKLGASVGVGILKGLALVNPGGVMSVVATSYEAAFNAAFHAHSPSRRFVTRGATIPQGIALGVDQGRPLVSKAIAGMATLSADAFQARSVAEMVKIPPPDFGPAPANTNNTKIGGARSVSIGELHYHAAGKEDAHQAAISIRDELARLLEGVGSQIGAEA